MKLKIPLIIFLGTIACFALAALFGSFAEKSSFEEYAKSLNIAYHFSSHGNMENRATEEIFQESDINEIRLKATSTDIKLEKSPDEKVHIFYTSRNGNSSHAKPQIKDGVMSFNLQNFVSDEDDVKFKFFNGGGFGLIVDDASARLQIPTGIKKIQVKTVSGNIQAESLSFDSAEIETVSGDAILKNFSATDLLTRAISGGVNLQGFIERLNGKTVSGDIKIYSDSAHPNISLTTTSGSTTVAFQSLPDISLNIITRSGNVDIDHRFWPQQIEGKIQNLKLGSAIGTVEIKTLSGDAQISQAYLNE